MIHLMYDLFNRMNNGIQKSIYSIGELGYSEEGSKPIKKIFMDKMFSWLDHHSNL